MSEVSIHLRIDKNGADETRIRRETKDRQGDYMMSDSLAAQFIQLHHREVKLVKSSGTEEDLDGSHRAGREKKGS